MKNIPNSLEKLSKLVGNTPLIDIGVSFEGKKLNIFAKYVLVNYYLLV